MAKPIGLNSPKGSEHSALALPKTAISEERGTESATLDAQNGAQTDPDLAELIRHWPTLHESARLRIMAIVRQKVGPDTY